MSEQTKPPIHEAMAIVQSKVENLAREADGQSGGAKFKYATLDSVLTMLRPLMAEVGLSVRQFVQDDTLRTVIIDSHGAGLDCGAYNMGPFTTDQKRGAAISYARRYQLSAIFFVTQEEDPDKSNKVWASKKARKNFELIVTNKIDVAMSTDELGTIYTANKGKIVEMQQSPDGDDQVCAHFILARFTEAKEAIIRADASAKSEDDSKPIGGY